MKAGFALVVAVAFVAMAAEIQSASVLEKHPIDWYDCSGKPDGNYLHPSDCTRFISCSGYVASERDCGACDPKLNPTRCPSVGRLVYNNTVDRCLWADETECQLGDDGIRPTEPTAPPTEPTAPPTEPTELPTDPTRTTNRPTQTTERPRDPSTTETPENDGPIEGEACDPTECKTKGYCLNYYRCDNNTKTWVKEKCGEGLLWNPLGPNGEPHMHGGNCGDPKKLFNETLEEYWRDPECLECYWKETGECSSTYLYQPPKQYYPIEHELECDAGLVFVKEKETCFRCQDVQKSNGDYCC